MSEHGVPSAPGGRCLPDGPLGCLFVGSIGEEQARAAVETLPAGDQGYLLEVLQKQAKAKAKEQK